MAAPSAELIATSDAPCNELTSPLESRTTTLQNGLSEFVITGLSRGTYAGLAFVDTNGNGQVDLAEDGSPAEPFGLVKVRTQDEPKTLSNGAFEVMGDPVFLKIHLLRPNSVSPSRQSEGVKQ